VLLNGIRIVLVMSRVIVNEFLVEDNTMKEVDGLTAAAEEGSDDGTTTITFNPIVPNDSIIIHYNDNDDNNNNVKELKELVRRMQESQLIDSGALIKAQLKALELDTAMDTIAMLEKKLNAEKDKVSEIQSNAMTELLLIRLSKNELQAQNKELEEEMALAHKARHLAVVQYNDAIDKLKSLCDERLLYDDNLSALEKKIVEYEELLTRLNAENQNLSENLSYSLKEKELLEVKVADMEAFLEDYKLTDIKLQSAMQAKATFESRALKLENEVARLTKEKEMAVSKLDEAKSLMKKAASDVSECNDSKDMIVREKNVLVLENKTYEQQVKQLIETLTVLQFDNDNLVEQLSELRVTSEASARQSSLYEEEIERVNYTLLSAQNKNKELEEELTTVLREVYKQGNDFDD